MGSGNEPAGQQAMTSERLAWVLEHIATIPAGREHTFVPVADLQMLRAEVERLRAREAVLLAVVRVVANMEHRVGWAEILTLGAYDALIEQARALLASTAAAAAGGAGQGVSDDPGDDPGDDPLAVADVAPPDAW